MSEAFMFMSGAALAGFIMMESDYRFLSAVIAVLAAVAAWAAHSGAGVTL